jgi:hypothetical protein
MNQFALYKDGERIANLQFDATYSQLVIKTPLKNKKQMKKIIDLLQQVFIADNIKVVSEQFSGTKGKPTVRVTKLLDDIPIYRLSHNWNGTRKFIQLVEDEKNDTKEGDDKWE